MNRKIGAKDLITLGIFTVIYFVIGAALFPSRFYSHYGPFFPGSLGAHQWNCIYAVHNEG